MKPYRAILFDLFSTVALWRPERLPVFEWRGRTSHSTAGVLREIVETHAPSIPFERFVEGLESANETLAARRSTQQREFPSTDRFALALSNAGHPATDATRAIAQLLSERHMALLSDAVHVPEEHTTFLATLAQRYPLALVSNFDHGDTARSILTRDGAAAYFDPIVISDEHGRRKPHPSIFEDTLAALGVAPGDALYVGDSAEDDIVGARNAGLDIAWVNRRGNDVPADVPQPDHIVRAIPDLAPLLLA